ncbi:AraC-like DNA-binding protein [Bacteroides heparinolyticus]|uniref:AraC-like DNA-binding protein n=1 Tax=Prevotella heparinolytica TaxID=28113 RepID=A0A4R2LVK2_9BACE|nr:AraC family transcriptional regulator [Bacteroides heparinolyticus]TCO94990.1 AraC-like DNA-binding protein [Bacteroides heparinolyticus]
MGLETYCKRQINCNECPQKSEGVLVYHHYSKGQHFSAEKFTQNCMLFMLQGELLVNSEEYPGTTLQSRQIILQAIGSKVELLALTEVEYIVYWFTELPVLCEERYKEILERSQTPLTYTPLTAIAALQNQLDFLVAYLKDQPYACGRYLEIKCKELVYILTCYYPLPQISSFFYPISTYTESFQYFVMQNYDKVKNVEEFAHLGGYTTTTFRRLFKNMYGVPVYEWILDKKREGILNDLQYTKQRISVISSRYGFDSLSHFAHFCKDSFGDTPRNLRKRLVSGEKITIVYKRQDKDSDDE